MKGKKRGRCWKESSIEGYFYFFFVTGGRASFLLSLLLIMICQNQWIRSFKKNLKCLDSSPINSKYSHEMCMKMDKYVYMCVWIFTQTLFSACGLICRFGIQVRKNKRHPPKTAWPCSSSAVSTGSSMIKMAVSLPLEVHQVCTCQVSYFRVLRFENTPPSAA